MNTTDIQNELSIKWERLQKAMKEENADGCLLTISMNLYYISDSNFNGYFYLPAQGSPYIFLKRPGRIQSEYIFNIHKPEQIAEILREHGIEMPRKLLLEGDELSHNEYLRLQNIFKPEECGNASAVIRRLRMIKTPWEIGQFRISARKHEQVYSEIPDCYRPGMTDLELQLEIEKRMRQHGSLGLFRAFGNNMEVFMGSLLAGDNAGEPSPFDFALGGGGVHPSHPLGANGTRLKEGLTIMVDMCGTYTAYQTDMTRVFSVGEIKEEAYRAHQVSIDMQEQLIRNAGPGTPCADIYNACIATAQKEGLSHCFMGNKQQAKFVGHGVGLQINELPVIAPRSKDALQPGMVFAFEPKFVIPDTGAVGIENTFLVTENGLEKITQFREEIIRLE